MCSLVTVYLFKIAPNCVKCKKCLSPLDAKEYDPKPDLIEPECSTIVLPLNSNYWTKA